MNYYFIFLILFIAIFVGSRLIGFERFKISSTCYLFF